jgi:hypothetical protein
VSIQEIIMKPALYRIFAACLIAAGAVAAWSSDACADVNGVLSFEAARVESLDDDNLADSQGLGATMHVVGRRTPMRMSIGGFAALGQPDGNKDMRDIYDIHFDLGLNPETRNRWPLVPFVSVGVDFLYVNTRMGDGTPAGSTSAAGMTMGMNARGGFFGFLGERWVYHASVAYIGAVVPGTGEGLDGLVVQLGLGKTLFQ